MADESTAPQAADYAGNLLQPTYKGVPTAPITVIIPLHNGATVISDALDSIFAQSVPPAEVIVVDDASQDGGAKVAAKHPVQPHIIYLPENRGVAFARNIGILESSSKYVAFLDQDDLWLPCRLERIAAHLERHPDWGALITGVISVAADEDRAIMQTQGHRNLDWVEHWRPRARLTDLLSEIALPPDPPAAAVSTRELLNDSVIITVSFVVNRRSALAVGGFPSWLRSADDWVLLQLISHYESVHYVDQRSVLYRIHPENTSITTNWRLPLLAANAAVRLGGNILDGADRLDVRTAGYISDSRFLVDLVRGLAADDLASALAACQLLATDSRDRNRLIRAVTRSVTRNLVMRWPRRFIRLMKVRSSDYEAK